MKNTLAFHDLFCAALANSSICTGTAHEYELKRWFGDRGGITRQQIAARQALEYAEAAYIALNS